MKTEQAICDSLKDVVKDSLVLDWRHASESMTNYFDSQEKLEKARHLSVLWTQGSSATRTRLTITSRTTLTLTTVDVSRFSNRFKSRGDWLNRALPSFKSFSNSKLTRLPTSWRGFAKRLRPLGTTFTSKAVLLKLRSISKSRIPKLDMPSKLQFYLVILY